MTTLTIYMYAIVLGALHAFEPGHGKTLIAAYMVGTKGRAMDGVLLGIIVTVTHTFSVVLLGLAAWLLSHTYSSEVLHNWLGLFSAALILIVGIWMLRQRLSGSGHGHFHLFGGHHHHHDHSQAHSHEHHHPHTHPHSHDHDDHHEHTSHHNHSHDHHDHHHHSPNSPDHSHEHEHHHPHTHSHEHDRYHEHSHDSHEQIEEEHSHTDHIQEKKNPWELFMLGISGGIIPCPAAIATLLAAIAAGKIAQGLSVTLFFSLGLGAVMMTIGVVLSQAGRLTGKISENLDFARRMGIVSALLIIGIGSYTMLHSIRNIWF